MYKGGKLQKEFLVKEFCELKKTQTQIATEVGCSLSYICILIKEYGLKPPAYKKYIGKKYGHLTVVEYVGHDNNSHPTFNCLCDCGKTIVVRSYSLPEGGDNRSCGCVARKRGQDHPLYRGYGELRGAYWSRVLRGAKDRNLEVLMTIEDAWYLFLEQGRRCALTGVRLEFAKRGKYQCSGTASLDRIDSSKGYFYDNVQWVHKEINEMKNSYTQKEFIDWCKLVADHNK